MARITIPAFFALTVSLAACAQTPTSSAAAPATPVADPTSRSHCDASKASAAIGQLPTSETQESARTSAGAEMVRVLRHNQPITKEFRVGRLNLVLDEEGRIASVNCS